MFTIIQVLILDKADCISHNANTPYKSKFSLFNYRKIIGQTELFSISMATGLGEGKL